MSALPHQIGPYRILASLGKGGMGIVYRAEHRETGQPMAVKHVQVAQTRLVEGIRREIHALARLCHPGIVRIEAEGIHEGLPWYAMELVEGSTLREWAGRQVGTDDETRRLRHPCDGVPSPRNWWTLSLGQVPDPGGLSTAPVPPATPAPVRSVLTVIRRLCSALSYLHGEGIVHRDLKPDNVLVRQDGAPLIVDFGLAAVVGGEVSRETLTADLGGAGTVQYMAPEQIRGSLVDARADLYALGCILYELLTGRPPFAECSLSRIIEAHENEAPVPPSGRVDGIEEGLDRLVLRLLAKRPRDRLGYAADVAAELARFGAGDGLLTGAPRARSYLYRPEMAGREAQLGVLRQGLGSALAGRGSFIAVGGESGVGKTRLAREIAREALGRDFQVLTGEGLDIGGTALQALRKPLRAIADRCRERGTAETEKLLGPRGKVLAPYEPALVGLPGQEAYPEPAELPAREAKFRVCRYLTLSLDALSDFAPLLLILDDLQWGDDLTIEWLKYALRTSALVGRPWMVLCTYRTEEVGPGLAGALEMPGWHRVELSRLDSGSIGAMVMDMLALEAVPGRFASFLHRHSEGNPFFVAEYLRLAVEEGLLWRDIEGRWQVAEAGEEPATDADYKGLPIPRSLMDLVGRRLKGLSEAGAAITRVASVVGRESWTGLLSRVAGIEEGAFLAALEELRLREVLAESAPGMARFLHDKIREIAYGGIDEADRPVLHRRVAEALERGCAAEREEQMGHLGRHWELAGQREKARACYLPAARRAVERFDHDEAARLYRAFLALVEAPSSESVAARGEMAEKVLQLRGRFQEAAAELERAVAESQEISDRMLEGESLRQIAVLRWLTAGPEETRGLYERALAIHREVGDRRGEGRALGGLALVHQRQGRVEEAEELLEQALGIALEVGDRACEGRTLGNMAVLHHDRGEMDEARKGHEQALAVFREAGHRLGVGVTLANLADLHADQGRMSEARELYEQALVITREVGIRRDEGIALGHLADLVRLADGDLPRAFELAVRSEALLRDLGECLELASTLCGQGHLRLAQGESARPVLAEVERLARKAGAGPESDLGRAVAKLGRAQSAFEGGERHRLFRGELIEEIGKPVLELLTVAG